MNITTKLDELQIISDQPLTVKRVTISFEQVKTNELYHDYKLTPLQYEINSSISSQQIKISISFARRLTRTEAKYAKICKFNPEIEQWEILKTDIDLKNQILKTEMNQIGSIGVFTNNYFYSSFTQKIADKYPSWSRIRKTNKSIGQQFLNFFGMKFEEIEDFFQYIEEQKYIGTADIYQHDWVYQYKIPALSQNDQIKLFHYDEQPIEEIETIKQFFYNPSQEGCLIDYEKGEVYSLKDYKQINIQVYKQNQILTYQAQSKPYHIWNAFDEIGLLLDIKRLHLEKNEQFKERILDVFRYPANSSEEGLINGIARELNMITHFHQSGNELKKIKWKNDFKPLFIENSTRQSIDPRSIRIDGKPLTPDQYKIDALSNIYIYPFELGVEHEVSFIVGIETFELFDQINERLYRMKYDPQGKPTPRLIQWVEYINMVSPIMWDYFKWDEGFWDTINEKYSGLSFLPHFWDTDMSVWDSYRIRQK